MVTLDKTLILYESGPVSLHVNGCLNPIGGLRADNDIIHNALPKLESDSRIDFPLSICMPIIKNLSTGIE